MTYVLRAYTIVNKKAKPVALLHVSGTSLCGGLGLDKPRTWQTRNGAERYAMRLAMGDRFINPDHAKYLGSYQWRVETLTAPSAVIEQRAQAAFDSLDKDPVLGPLARELQTLIGKAIK